MSAQQYIGNLGQLAQVGGGQKQLEEIMANAVARGVGNAKNISDLVATITGIANRRTSEAGVNVTAGVTSLMNRTVTSLMTSLPGAENEAARLSRAQLDMGNINSRVTGVGMELPSVVGFASLSQGFRDVSASGRVAMKKVNMEQIAQIESLQSRIEKGGPQKKELEQQLIGLTRMLNISEAYVDESGKLKAGGKEATAKLRESKVNEMMTYVAGATDSEGRALSPGIREWIKTKGKSKITEAERAAIGTFMQSSAEGASMILSEVGKDNEVVKANLGKMGPKTTAAAGIKIAEAGVEGKAVAQGQEVFGKNFEQALTKFSTDLTNVLNNIDPRKLQTNAAEAAEKMNIDFRTFETSVKTFDEVVKRLEQKLELTPVGEKVSNVVSSVGDSIKKTFEGHAKDTKSTMRNKL